MDGLLTFIAKLNFYCSWLVEFSTSNEEFWGLDYDIKFYIYSDFQNNTHISQKAWFCVSYGNKSSWVIILKNYSIILKILGKNKLA